MIRRYFLLGLGGFLFNLVQTNTVLSQTSGTVFNIRWRDLDVGYSSINLQQKGTKIYVNVDVKINVSILDPLLHIKFSGHF